MRGNLLSRTGMGGMNLIETRDENVGARIGEGLTYMARK